MPLVSEEKFSVHFAKVRFPPTLKASATRKRKMTTTKRRMFMLFR